MLKHLIALTLFAVLASTSFSVTADAQRWKLIKRHNVSNDAVEELVDLKGASGSYVAFRLRARGGTVKVDQFVLNFHDNTLFVSEAPFNLRSGERTRILAEDRSSERFPENALIKYKDGAEHSRYARLEIWGLQTRSGRYAKRPEKLMPTPPPPPRVSQSEPTEELVANSVLVAHETAGREVESATIRVSERIGKFKRLRLAIREAPLEIEKLTVKFDDGATSNFAVKGALRPNTSTPWFEIDSKRFISSVSMTFAEKTSLTTPPQIEIWGTHADGWLDRDGEGGNFNDGWLLIGAQTAGAIGFDNDVIPLAELGDGFQQIRVNVMGRPVTLNQLRVIYENGEEDIVPVRSRIDDGDVFGPINLRGETHKIREIRTRYRSRVIDKAIRAKGTALVQVWAKR